MCVATLESSRGTAQSCIHASLIYLAVPNSILDKKKKFCVRVGQVCVGWELECRKTFALKLQLLRLPSFAALGLDGAGLRAVPEPAQR